jgi:polyisoprenyl-teichoic acid--peptidoglycan teichoic acid transferase
VYDRSSPENEGGNKVKKRLLLTLAGISFFVFVSGSFVFAYLVLSAAAIPLPLGGITLPKIGGVSLPGMPAITSPGSSGSDAASAGKQRLNFLLMGIDQRNDEKGQPTRSDSMIVVSVDQVNKTAAMISLPRDMWVDIPGYAQNRINVANFLGDAYKEPGGGPALAEKTVEANFGLHIDYWARIDFSGFEKVIDTLGGVDVDVENAIVDNEYPTEDYGTMKIYIPTGRQHMNGQVALEYARSRHSENDFGRARRQQKLLLAVRDRAMALDVIPKLPSLMNTLTGMVQTDIPTTEFIRLANLARQLDTKNVASLVIDETLAPPFQGQDGAALLMPNKPEIRKAIGSLLADPVVKSEGATIEVINGTNTSGLAAKASDFLSAQGFDVVKVSTADRSDYKVTQILVSGEKKGTASQLAMALKVAPQAIIAQPSPATAPSGAVAASSSPDIRIIIGQDFTPPQ